MNIGESAFNISNELKEKFPVIDWKAMYSLRNIIAHAYHSLDESIVWDIAKNELPSDKLHVQNILKQLE
jgi:uncharacterized protein with HEPN domain